jgi:hypothetical protein
MRRSTQQLILMTVFICCSMIGLLLCKDWVGQWWPSYPGLSGGLYGLVTGMCSQLLTWWIIPVGHE